MPKTTTIYGLMLIGMMCALGTGCLGRMSSNDASQSDPMDKKDQQPVDPDDPIIKDPEVKSVCETKPQDPGFESARWMTQVEVNHTLGQMFPGVAVPKQTMDIDTRVGPFVVNGEQKILKEQVLEFRDMARRVAPLVASNADDVMGCQGQRTKVFTGQASGQTLALETYNMSSPQKTRTLVFVGRGNDQNDWNSIWEFHAYENGQRVKIVSAEASDNYEVEDRIAPRAIDDDPSTRWAGQGRNVTVVFTLEREATIDRLDISWYDGDKRKADFEIFAQTQGAGLDDPVACRDHFLNQIGERAFRRPLKPAELTGLQNLYNKGAEAGGKSQGVHYVVEALLQAPSFMYIHEQAPQDGDARDLDQFEVAQRMASLLWRALPDQTLMDAAKAGQLNDPAVRETHARRMLADPRAKEAMRDMILQWFGIDTILTKDLGSAFTSVPEDQREALRQSLLKETTLFVNDVIDNQNSSYYALLTNEQTYWDERLVNHHNMQGMVGMPDDNGIYKVKLPGRHGMLTQTSFLVIQHGAIHRGQFMRSELLCSPVPGPGGDVDTSSIKPVEGESRRDVVERRMKVQPCGGCHQMMDPLGLTLDVYDDLGRFQTQDEHGNAVFSTGNIVATKDINGEVKDLPELAGKFAQSTNVRACVSKKLFTYGFGRIAQPTDSCTISRMESVLEQNDGNLKEALIQMIKTDTFMVLSAKGETP